MIEIIYDNYYKYECNYNNKQLYILNKFENTNEAKEFILEHLHKEMKIWTSNPLYENFNITREFLHQIENLIYALSYIEIQKNEIIFLKNKFDMEKYIFKIQQDEIKSLKLQLKEKEDEFFKKEENMKVMKRQFRDLYFSIQIQENENRLLKLQLNDSFNNFEKIENNYINLKNCIFISYYIILYFVLIILS